LNIANWGLIVGTTGQAILYRSVFPQKFIWLVAVMLFPPWLLIYVISFFRVPPVGPKRFRRIIIFAMCWYAGALLLFEIFHALPWISHQQDLPIGWARAVAYGAILSYIVFIRTCIEISRYDRKGRSQTKNATASRNI
jgi:hypothetical protein